MEYNEKDIIKKCKSGDHTAFEALINNYDKKVFNTVYRLVGNKEDALDLTQEVFIKVYRNINSFRVIHLFLPGFIGWLLTHVLMPVGKRRMR